MRPFGRLLAPEAARARLLRAVRPVRAIETVPLGDALGRVAARTVRAPRPIPAFSRATWDGYAVRSRDLRVAREGAPVRLRVVGEIFAEERLRAPIRSGEAAAIATGGCLPEGADSVVIFEATRASGGSIEVRAPVRPGDRIAQPGDDYPRGAAVVRAGEVLTPAGLGGLAAIGARSASVRVRPIVALVPNGNELVAPGGALRRGQIFESNNQTLAAVVRACGGVPRPVAPVPDDPARIESTLRRVLANSDLVLATGGSSVGERDYLPAIFPRLGRLLFHGLAVRPGKPTLAAVSGGKLLIGMPGHPTSCLSNGHWLLLPVLRRLAGLPGPGWTDGEARLDRSLPPFSPTMSTVVPVRVVDGLATPTFHDSSAITSLAGANAFALVPPGAPRRRKGDRLALHRLPPPLGAPA